MNFDYLLLAVAIVLFASVSVPEAESHGLFTDILADYVHEGSVDYKSLCTDERLNRYIRQLAETNPDTIASDEARLAFWINAYNAYTLKIICDEYPVKSINDLHFGGLIVGTVLKKTVWDKDLVEINNRKTTLNTIEHKIIRPIFKDPRAHFALVCASKSCPPLRPEAFEAENLDEQLDDQGRIFLSDEFKNSFDIEKRQAHISKIFDWYSKDFGGRDEKVLEFLAGFLPEDIANKISSDPKSWKVRHKDYDWSLNDYKPETKQPLPLKGGKLWTTMNQKISSVLPRWESSGMS